MLKMQFNQGRRSSGRQEWRGPSWAEQSSTTAWSVNSAVCSLLRDPPRWGREHSVWEESGRQGFIGGIVLDPRGLWIRGTPLKAVHTVFVLDFNASDRHWFYIILSSSVTESDLAACHSKINTQERQMLVESKAGFNQNAGSLGRWWTQCLPKPPPKILLGHESFWRGKGT